MRDRYGNEVLSNYFYSNCLLEAIKAKLKNPKIRVRRIRQTWTRFPHFIWIDGGYIYEFGANESIPCKLLFHGYLRRRKRTTGYKNVLEKSTFERSGNHGKV